MGKILLKILVFVLIAAFVPLCFSCGNSNEPEPKSYTVIFDSDGGSAVEEQVVKGNSKLQYPNTPIKDIEEDYAYSFLGWYLGEDLWDFDNDVVVGDMTLIAKWERSANFGIITFIIDNGETVPNQKVIKGKKITEPTGFLTTKVVREGNYEYTYSFVGWLNDETLWNFETDVVSGDMTLTAKFELIKTEYVRTL